MNLEKTERLIAMLRQNGVSHFKSEDVEIDFGMPTKHIEVPTNTQLQEKAPPLQAVPPVELEIPHHVNEVNKLMKLSDEDLVDKLFPDYSQMEQKEA